MHFRVVIYVLGNIFLCLAATMLWPLVYSVYYSQPDTGAFLISVAITTVCGAVLRFTNKPEYELGRREGFAIVAFGWLGCAILGALPYYFSGIFSTVGNSFQEFSYCFFESMSGFTTTGATVVHISDSLPEAIASLPLGVLFWRSLTHWLGGMGIVVLSLAILPILGVGGMQLYQAEVPGPQKDRLSPRIVQTAQLLWQVYLVFSIVEATLLRIGGMSWYESFCHTFGTMATGGFSTRNTSIGEYNSLYIDIVVIVFMLIAGTNFSLHYRALKGDIRAYLRDAEFRFYVLVLSTFTLILALDTHFRDLLTLGDAIRHAGFQVVSLTTTTGYGTYDFELWHGFSQFILLTLMFVGGCAGSTGGSMKHVRILLLMKQAYAEIQRQIHPHAVYPVRLGARTVPPDVIRNVLGFFWFFILIFIIGTMIMAALGLDLMSAISSVAATLGNIGPGLGSVGPMDNYAHIPLVGKYLLSFLMLLGRLEIYTVLVMFVPATWRR